MNNRWQGLAPIPALSVDDTRFRRNVGELLKEIAKNGHRLLIRDEQLYQPDSKSWWLRRRLGHCEYLAARRRPSAIFRNAVWVRFTAAAPFAVTRKNRFDLPPRCGVGSPRNE